MRKTADAALDVIQDVDEEWAVKIRRMKFESYNQEWLAVIEVRLAYLNASSGFQSLALGALRKEP